MYVCMDTDVMRWAMKATGNNDDIMPQKQRKYEIALWSVIHVYIQSGVHWYASSTAWWNNFIDSYLGECVFVKGRWNASENICQYRMRFPSRSSSSNCLFCLTHRSISGIFQKKGGKPRTHIRKIRILFFLSTRRLSVISTEKRENFILFDNDSTQTKKNANGMLIHINPLDVRARTYFRVFVTLVPFFSTITTLAFILLPSTLFNMVVSHFASFI